MQKIIFFLLLQFIFTASLDAQEVIVSKELNVRSDYAYEILGSIRGDILLYRDKGFDHRITSFDQDLGFRYERKLKLDKNKVEVYGLASVDTAFYVFFGFEDEGFHYIKTTLYDEGAAVIKEDTLIVDNDNYNLRKFRYLLSEDRSKALLYRFSKGNELDLVVYDVYSSEAYWYQRYAFTDFNLDQDVIDLKVTNEGYVVLLSDNLRAKSKKEDYIVELFVFTPGSDTPRVVQIPYTNEHVNAISLTYDNKNRRICIAGLYGEKNKEYSEGYFLFNKKLNQIGSLESFQYTPFDDVFIREVYGRKASKKKGLRDHIINDIIWRDDGGILIVTEMNREFARRSSYQGTSINNSYYNPRGWVDFYNEDIVVIGLHPDGKEYWKTVLFKKQFSQDDEGIYSSFFIFKTPSRLRMVFNDEIKKENTVSEYVLSATGKSKRTSVLSTEYQKLKLRFRDALQLSSNEFIVPSERNNNLSLVKIKYL